MGREHTSADIKSHLTDPGGDRGALLGGAVAAGRIGSLLAGRYEVLGVIDSGGQGCVYRARDRREGDEVAVKVIKDGFADDPDWRERLLREGHALAQLAGTAAVRVYEQCWSEDGALCTVMELLRGADLQTVVERFEAQGGTFPIDAIPIIFEPVVATLERAHSLGIVHRDLKPANLFVVDGEHAPTIRVLDFGFAKFMRMRSFTAAGTVAGSPSYVAPEMWMGSKSQDHRIDVYSLAAVVFRVLARHPPFHSSDLLELCRLATLAPRPSLRALRPDLPAEIDDWVEQSLAIRPEERFQTVRAMYRALTSALGQST
jgi:serine/threonine protein kinase